MARILDGTTDIPTAGTRVQVSNTTNRVLWLYLRAPTANTGSIWFGGSTIAANRGKGIAAGGSFEINPGLFNHVVLFSTLYVDTATSGNDVEWLALVE